MTGRGDAQHHLTGCPLCGRAVAATRTEWSCDSGHRGPHMVLVSVHEPACPDVMTVSLLRRGTVKRERTMDVSPYALPHSCLPGGFAGDHVAVVAQLTEPHLFRKGKMSRGGMALCAHCRNPKRGHPA